MQSKSVKKEVEDLIRERNADIFVIRYDENVGISEPGSFKNKYMVKKWLKKADRVILSKSRTTTISLEKIRGFREGVKIVILL